MLARIKKLLERNSLYIALLCTITITILSLIDLSKAPVDVGGSDKFSHTVAYFFLTLFWLYGVVKTESRNRAVIWVVLLCFIYGIIIEALQGTITAYRTASYLDILANSIGIVLAVLTFQIVERKKPLI